MMYTFCRYSIALDWDITWMNTAMIGNDIASFLVVTVKNNEIQRTFSKLASFTAPGTVKWPVIR